MGDKAPRCKNQIHGMIMCMEIQLLLTCLKPRVLIRMATVMDSQEQKVSSSAILDTNFIANISPGSPGFCQREARHSCCSRGSICRASQNLLLWEHPHRHPGQTDIVDREQYKLRALLLDHWYSRQWEDYHCSYNCPKIQGLWNPFCSVFHLPHLSQHHSFTQALSYSCLATG